MVRADVAVGPVSLPRTVHLGTIEVGGLAFAMEDYKAGSPGLALPGMGRAGDELNARDRSLLSDSGIALALSFHFWFS